jgi:ATP-binding cassette subfamily F protein 3
MLDDLSNAAPRSTQTELRSLLGCFLFSEDDVFKRIGVLSGGERNRYALARMLLRPSNFLLLDEPTNHLDMRAKDVLLESLQSFTGTVVFVSHDRYFIDKLATRVFEIGDGEVRVYPGNYEDYLWRKGGKPLELDLSLASGNGHGAAVAGERAAQTPPVKRINPMKLKKLEERCGEVERGIAQAESDIAGYESALSRFISTEETVRVASLLDSRRAELSGLMKEWERLSADLETSKA